MGKQKSMQFFTRVQGEYACFTIPTFKSERASYPSPTPSACRGIIDSVCWEPAIRHCIDRIFILNPPEFVSIRRNELRNNKGDWGATQRTTRALKNVDYIIESHFVMTPKAKERDSIFKFEHMYLRRLKRGQFYHAPCLGQREFIVKVERFVGDPYEVVCKELNMDIGTMTLDFESSDSNHFLVFDAKVRGGVIEVPSTKPVLKEGDAC